MKLFKLKRQIEKEKVNSHIDTFGGNDNSTFKLNIGIV